MWESEGESLLGGLCNCNNDQEPYIFYVMVQIFNLVASLLLPLFANDDQNKSL